MVQDCRESHNRGAESCGLNSPMERRISIFNSSRSQYPEERLDSTLRYGMQSARRTLQPHALNRGQESRRGIPDILIGGDLDNVFYIDTVNYGLRGPSCTACSGPCSGRPRLTPSTRRVDITSAAALNSCRTKSLPPTFR